MAFLLLPWLLTHACNTLAIPYFSLDIATALQTDDDSEEIRNSQGLIIVTALESHPFKYTGKSVKDAHWKIIA